MSQTAVTYRIKLFAAAKQLAGRGEIEIELARGASVGMLRAAIVAHYPELTSLVKAGRIAAGASYVDDSTLLDPSAELALIPPVSGG